MNMEVSTWSPATWRRLEAQAWQSGSPELVVGFEILVARAMREQPQRAGLPPGPADGGGGFLRHQRHLAIDEALERMPVDVWLGTSEWAVVWGVNESTAFSRLHRLRNLGRIVTRPSPANPRGFIWARTW